MKEADISAWPRREIFDFFSQTKHPFYSLSFRLDIAPAYRFAKTRGLSFYCSMVWLVTEAMNRVETFRYTVADGRVCLLPRREPSFPDMSPFAMTANYTFVGDGFPVPAKMEKQFLCNYQNYAR